MQSTSLQYPKVNKIHYKKYIPPKKAPPSGAMSMTTLQEVHPPNKSPPPALVPCQWPQITDSVTISCHAGHNTSLDTSRLVKHTSEVFKSQKDESSPLQAHCFQWNMTFHNQIMLHLIPMVLNLQKWFLGPSWPDICCPRITYNAFIPLKYHPSNLIHCR